MSRGREPWWRVPVTSRKEVAGTQGAADSPLASRRLGALSPKRTAPRALVLGDGGYAQTYAAWSIGGPAFMSRQVSRPNPAGPWFSPNSRLRPAVRRRSLARVLVSAHTRTATSIAAEYLAGAEGGLAVIRSVSARVLAVLFCFDRRRPTTTTGT